MEKKTCVNTNEFVFAIVYRAQFLRLYKPKNFLGRGKSLVEASGIIKGTLNQTEGILNDWNPSAIKRQKIQVH